MNAMLQLISYTAFRNVTPKAADRDTRNDVPWSEVVGKIETPKRFESKHSCPLISLATYGELLTDKGCIRHAKNVQQIFGVEGDYDREQMSIEEAQRLLQAANIETALYTSPSFLAVKPRWRVLAPLNEPHAPEQRAAFVARINRVLGGILSRESFVLSQSYFIGAVEGVEYRSLQSHGRMIDQCEDIEPLWYQDPQHPNDSNFDATTDAELREAFAVGEDRYQSMLKLSARWACKGLAADDIKASLDALLEASPDGPKNSDGLDLRTRTKGLALTAVKKYGETRKPKDKGKPPPGESHLEIVCAADVVTRPVVWLVPNTFAIGKTSMMAGDPGVAKSTITIDLIASVTNVAKFPWEGCVQGSVLILSAEDDAADTIVPRLIAAGADLSKVHIIQAAFSIGEDDQPHRRQFNLKNDLELLDAALVRYPGTVLITIDPVSAYLSGTDAHRDAEVREVLAPVAEFAGRTRCAVLLVSHLNKGSAKNGASAIYRVIGSIGFVGAVRSTVLVTKDHEDPDGKRRLFISLKNNNAPEPEGALAYRVENQEGQPRIAWESERIDISAQEALDHSPKSDHDAEVDTWVMAQLTAGNNKSKALIDAGIFSYNKLKASKRRLRINAVLIPANGDEKRYWIWKLPVKGDGSDM
jgi:putative DNA primase/helicase